MRRPDCCSSGYCRRLFCTLHEKILESNRLCRLPALLFILPQSIYDSDVIDMSPNYVLSTAAFAWTKCCSHQWCYCCAARTDPEEHIPDRLCPMTSPCPTANVLEIEMTYLRTLRSVLCLQQQIFFCVHDSWVVNSSMSRGHNIFLMLLLRIESVLLCVCVCQLTPTQGVAEISDQGDEGSK